MTNGGMIGVSAGDGTNYTFGSRSQAGSLSNVQDAVYATLPPGLILAPASGVITGTPQVAGTWSVMFKVTDSFNVSTNKMLPMTIWDDSDGDGIPDWWMYLYFGHPTGLSNDLSRANDDADRDRDRLVARRCGRQARGPTHRGGRGRGRPVGLLDGRV